MPEAAIETTREHANAMRAIQEIFDAIAYRMNGRQLRKVITAYLVVRGLGELPFRVRSLTTFRRRHYSERYSFQVSYPDPVHAPPRVRNFVNIPAGFHADFEHLVSAWFERHTNYRTVDAIGKPITMRTISGYDGYSVEADSWFHIQP